jgi:hypothetical protein
VSQGKPAGRQHDPVELVSGKWTIRFLWDHDRFRHEVFCDGQLIAASIEGTSRDPWPASPPLQSLSLENIGSQMAILGVGAAGRGHWSVSVVADDRDSLKLELACRISASVLADPDLAARVEVGNRYRLTDNCEPTICTNAVYDRTTDSIRPANQEQNPRVWSFRFT